MPCRDGRLYVSSKSGVHAMPARSPLTAALRQRSRRAVRQVVCPLAVFLRLINWGQ